MVDLIGHWAINSMNKHFIHAGPAKGPEFLSIYLSIYLYESNHTDGIFVKFVLFTINLGDNNVNVYDGRCWA